MKELQESKYSLMRAITEILTYDISQTMYPRISMKSMPDDINVLYVKRALKERELIKIEDEDNVLIIPRNIYVNHNHIQIIIVDWANVNDDKLRQWIKDDKRVDDIIENLNPFVEISVPPTREKDLRYRRKKVFVYFKKVCEYYLGNILYPVIQNKQDGIDLDKGYQIISPSTGYSFHGYTFEILQHVIHYNEEAIEIKVYMIHRIMEGVLTFGTLPNLYSKSYNEFFDDDINGIRRFFKYNENNYSEDQSRFIYTLSNAFGIYSTIYILQATNKRSDIASLLVEHKKHSIYELFERSLLESISYGHDTFIDCGQVRGFDYYLNNLIEKIKPITSSNQLKEDILTSDPLRQKLKLFSKTVKNLFLFMKITDNETVNFDIDNEYSLDMKYLTHMKF